MSGRETRIFGNNPSAYQRYGKKDILAWRIPWTEASGGLQFMCCKEYDTTEQLIHTHIHTHKKDISGLCLPIPGTELLKTLELPEWQAHFLCSFVIHNKRLPTLPKLVSMR